MGAVYALFTILQIAYLFERMDKTGILNDWGGTMEQKLAMMPVLQDVQ